jgi:hypothetical protein
MPGVDDVPTRQDTLIGVMVVLSGHHFTGTVTEFFSLSGAATTTGSLLFQKWRNVFSGISGIPSG